MAISGRTEQTGSDPTRCIGGLSLLCPSKWVTARREKWGRWQRWEKCRLFPPLPTFPRHRGDAD